MAKTPLRTAVPEKTKAGFFGYLYLLKKAGVPRKQIEAMVAEAFEE